MADIAIKPSISLVDEPFLNKAGKEALHLCMELSKEWFAYTISDKHDNKHLAFEAYPLTDSVNFQSALPELQQITDHVPLISRWKGSASIAINHHAVTIIPNPLFDEDKMGNYLDINFELDTDDLVLFDELTNIRAKNVFSFPRKAHTFFRERFGNITFHHFSTSLIEPFFLQYKNRDQPLIIIHVQKNSFQLIVFQNRALRLYNSYRYHNEDDFVYFIMFAFEQLKLDAEKHEVRLSGFIEKGSAQYQKLTTYIRDIRFESYMPAFRSISSEKNTGRNHFSLFNQYMCVS